MMALCSSLYKIKFFFTTVTAIVILLGTLMYVIEGGEHGFNNFPQSIYWAVITLTTVGYSDIVPTTFWGKFLASFIMITGYAIIAVPTEIVTVELSKASKKFRILYNVNFAIILILRNLNFAISAAKKFELFLKSEMKPNPPSIKLTPDIKSNKVMLKEY